MIVNEMVLIHKTPAKWSKRDWLETKMGEQKNAFPEKTLPESSQIFSLIPEDIYIQMSLEICENLGIDQLHIVQGVSQDEEKNWISEHEEGRYKINEKIWVY